MLSPNIASIAGSPELMGGMSMLVNGLLQYGQTPFSIDDYDLPTSGGILYDDAPDTFDNANSYGNFNNRVNDWGIFDSSGNVVLSITAVIASPHTVRHDIATYPTDKSQLASYNKIIRPYTHIVQYAKMGTADERAKFVRKLQSLAKNLKTYSVTTSDFTFLDANIIGFTDRKDVRNANMVVGEIYLQQVTDTDEFGYTSQSSGLDFTQSRIDSASEPQQAGGMRDNGTPSGLNQGDIK